jgi:hypothetical protein
MGAVSLVLMAPLLGLALLGPTAVLAQPPAPVPEERIFVVSDYRFDEQSLPGAPPVIRALCGTRCNALSANLESYMVYMMRGEWRLQKTASGQERSVALNNPYLTGGRCICIGDEYLVEPYVSPGVSPPVGR